MGTRYRHTQVGRLMLGGVGIAWAVAVWGSLRVSDPAMVVVAVLGGCVLLQFSTLTVIVRDEAIEAFFGPGLIRRRIPLGRIRAVRAVRTPWYYGWGIRLTPSGWLWNVSGLGGVELQFDDGRRFRIGSDEPDTLADALGRAMRTV